MLNEINEYKFYTYFTLSETKYEDGIYDTVYDMNSLIDFNMMKGDFFNYTTINPIFYVYYKLQGSKLTFRITFPSNKIGQVKYYTVYGSGNFFTCTETFFLLALGKWVSLCPELTRMQVLWLRFTGKSSP